MACDTAVVASDVGGIPEVVNDGETGELVHYDADEIGAFEEGLASAVNRIAGDSDLASRMAKAGRERAVTTFSWSTIAQQTLDVYRSLM